MKKKRFCVAMLAAVMLVVSVIPSVAYSQDQESLVSMQEMSALTEMELDSETVVAESDVPIIPANKSILESEKTNGSNNNISNYNELIGKTLYSIEDDGYVIGFEERTDTLCQMRVLIPSDPPGASNFYIRFNTEDLNQSTSDICEFSGLIVEGFLVNINVLVHLEKTNDGILCKFQFARYITGWRFENTYSFKSDTDTDDGNLYEGNLGIKTFIGWNEENKTASFDDGIDYYINEDTDLSFLDSLDELVGQKVLVVENSSEILTIKGIYPVQEVIGTVSQWGTSSIILNGEQYPAAKDWSMNETLVDANKPVRCYVHEGTIVAVETPQEKTGTLNGWKTTTSEITIDDETYIVDIDDLTFLNYLQIWMGHTIECTLFDNKVIDIEFPDYYQRYTAKVEKYNEETGEVYFSDGQYYFIAEDFEESPFDYIGKWVNYSVRTSQDQGTYLYSLNLVKSELIVTLEIDPENVFYRDNQYSLDSEIFVDRSDFEIPYFVTVENKTNAYSNKLLKEDPQFDITIGDVEVELPSGFSFGWLNEGEIHGTGKVIHAGDAATAEGYIRPGIWYSPEEPVNTYDVSCTVDTSAGEASDMGTITITVNYSDTDMDTLATEAAHELDDLSDNITMQMDDRFFNQDTTNRIAETLFSIAVMAKAEPKDLKESLTEDLFDQVFGDWKLKTGTNSYDVPVQIAVKTKEYGELIFEFKMHMHSYDINGSDYALWGSIDYSIVGGKGMEEVPGNLRNQSNVGVIARSDVTAFCNAAYELAEKEIKKAYDKVYGDGLNKVTDIVFGQTVKHILEEMDTSASDILFKIITTPGKSVVVKCPVDVYVYDETGELEASIVNDQIEKESDSIELEVIGDTKVITIWDGNYDLKLVSNGTGDMDITVTEYAGINNVLRVVDFYDIPLGENIEYLTEVQPDLLVSKYTLVDNQSEKITPDDDETLLEELEPGDVEEHVHMYGEPEFYWSDEYRTCIAVFSCVSGDDQQEIECAISSETTGPTCIEAGKTVYTATASFVDTEYTDTQEEVIPATGHTYEYTDNGDGTHTKACTAGDDTVTEPHTYQDGRCSFCGAEEPAGHIHNYGEPKFTWSDDYSSCTAVFTCADGDDQKAIECTVTSVNNADGSVSYTAVAEFNGESYTMQQTVAAKEEPEEGNPTGSGNNNNSGNSTNTNNGSSEGKASEAVTSDVYTGDDSNLVLWSSLLISMFSVAVIMLLIRKKKRL